MKLLDGLGIPTTARALATTRAYSDGTGKYLTKKAATTPLGLPIPGSAYTRALARTLLKRALPLPLQIAMELYEIYKTNQKPLPPEGWRMSCDNNAPSGTGVISNYLVSPGRSGGGCGEFSCINNQALTPTGSWTGSIITAVNQCSVRFLAPGSVPGRWDVMKAISVQGASPVCFNCSGGTLVSAPLVRMRRDLPQRVRERPPLIRPARPDYRTDPRSDPDYKPATPPAPKIEPPKPPPEVERPPWAPRPPPWRWIPPEWADPNLAPELVPPTAPTVDPPHRPFWQMPGTGTQPVLEQPPRHGTERGPRPPGPNQSPRVNAPPVVVFDPRTGTSVQLPPRITTPVQIGGPGVSIQINPPGTPPLVLRPPGRRVKERKFIVAVPAGFAKNAISAVTEGLDLIDCLHDALPKHLQAKRLRKPPHAPKGGPNTASPSWKRKAAAVYRGYLPERAGDYELSANDIMNAIVTCGQQQFMDRIYAEIGRAGGRAGRKLGMSTGTGFGGSARQAVTWSM